MERLPDEIEQTPGGKEFARKTEQKFHDKIQGKQSKEDLKIQRKQQKEYSDERKESREQINDFYVYFGAENYYPAQEKEAKRVAKSDPSLKKFFDEMRMYLDSDLSSKTNNKELSDLFSVMAILATQPRFREQIHAEAPFKQIIATLQRDNAPKLNGVAALANLCRDASTHEKLSNFGLGGLLVQMVRGQLQQQPKPDWQLVRQALRGASGLVSNHMQVSKLIQQHALMELLFDLLKSDRLYHDDPHRDPAVAASRSQVMKEVCDSLVNLAHNEANFEKILFKSSAESTEGGYAELFALVRGNRYRADGITILLWLAHCNKKIAKDARVKELVYEQKEKNKQLTKEKRKSEGKELDDDKEEEDDEIGGDPDREADIEFRNPFNVHWGDEPARPALVVRPPRIFQFRPVYGGCKVCKPVIYLYPLEEATAVQVRVTLKRDAVFTSVYPTYVPQAPPQSCDNYYDLDVKSEELIVM